ncbi:MAG: type IX secretion system sortase PorU, partial [Calditrichia bacterium]
RQYIVYASAAVQDIQQISSIQNTPNLRDSQRKGKFVIILPDEFYDAAEPLETFRESQQPFPLQTERVRLSEIYREFSSCVEDVTAIRNFLKWAYNNWQDYPEFVLLLGDGSYDYKGINFPNYINRVPAFEIEGATQTELDSRESDQYYVAFSSTSLGQLLPTIALGRVVANSITDIETYIEKVVKYSKSYNINNEANGWQTTLTFVADDENPGVPGSEWFHLRDTESLINNYVPRKFDITKIYLVDYETQAGGLSQIKPGATEDLLNQINRGTLMINFFGHGNPDTWAHEQVLTRSRDLSLIQNVDRLPLWVAATCTWGKYDDPGRSSMSEEMIWLKNRGGVAVLSATRPVFASSNRAFVHAFYQELFNDASDVETSRIVGNALLGSLLGTTNYQKFRFFGDPTLKLADPLYQVEIISISPDTLKALSTVTVQARVTDQFGNPLPQFQGEAIIKVFDTKDNLTARNGSIQYTKQGGTFFKGRVSVINGELSGKFIVPKSIKYDSNPTGRISIYAWSESNGDATGFNDGLLVYGTESIVDREGPQIDVSFENQPDFFDGDYVSRQPTLVVQITDENGINLTREVGHRIEISLDGKSRKDVTDFFVYDKDSYQSGKLRYTLPALSPGQHTLTISAWDNVNNFSEQEVTFRTISVSELALEEVVNYPNPFSEDTHFTFQFQSPSGFGEVKIKIYTVSGRLIQELEGFARPGFNKIEWDGRDRDGDRLANGVYIYKIVIDDGERKVEKIEKLAVLR